MVGLIQAEEGGVGGFVFMGKGAAIWGFAFEAVIRAVVDGG
jgi:hypothetical protein